MAKLQNLDKVFTVRPGVAVKVGHNREIERECVNVFVCRLYRSPIVSVEEYTNGYYIVLDTCGHGTQTTRGAMVDFCSVFGVDVGVSMAGGKLSARYKGVPLKPDVLGTITFVAEKE